MMRRNKQNMSANVKCNRGRLREEKIGSIERMESLSMREKEEGKEEAERKERQR